MSDKNVSNAAFVKTRDYFLGESLRPAENIPDLLGENRKIAISLAENVMSLIDVIANYFGIPTMELAMNALPEVSLQMEADGIREQAAARTYLDLKGAVPLADICKGTHAYPAPTLHCVAQEILRREQVAKYPLHSPLLQRIFGGTNEEKPNGNDMSGDEPNRGGDEAPAESEPDASSTEDSLPGT